MEKRTIFSGTATALITPFCDGNIDFARLGNIIDYQISSGIDALVIAGTTGEASTLTDTERYALYEFSAERCRGRIPLILGTGTNDTKTAVRHTKRAAELHADAALVVTPYYNKGTAKGIVEHYKSVANSADLPIILYNVPSRTGVNLSISAIEELIAEPNIVGLKEASDSTDRLTLLSCLTDSLSLYMGNDTQIFSGLALGARGVISVASNIAPKSVLTITQSFTRGELSESLSAQKALLPLCRALFLETNPAPIKYAMSKAGFCTDEIRLPLSMPSEDTRRAIDTLLDAL
ncbi:MAG: 4-hydroxy-tetrahydrodipicolinate synthase [Clostridia bacterium]|nr:4-hydroxy-tetrahydrodipicolinate synthase [Clostridia bacterium]